MEAMRREKAKGDRRRIGSQQQSMQSHEAIMVFIIWGRSVSVLCVRERGFGSDRSFFRGRHRAYLNRSWINRNTFLFRSSIRSRNWSY